MKKAFLSCAAAAMLAGCGGAQPPTPAAVGPGFATMPRVGTTAKRYRFRTLDNPADPAFNILTGINNAGVISGYGIGGSPNDPIRGYTLAPPYKHSNYRSESYPGSVQTQVLAIDNLGNTAGNFVDKQNRSWGFVEWNGVFKRYKQHPLYGLNNDGNTVVSLPAGYPNRIYTLNYATRKRTLIYKFKVSDGFAYGTGLNDAGDVVGVGGGGLGGSAGWAVLNGKLYGMPCYYGYDTSAAAINNNDEIVGDFYGRRSSDGFVLTNLSTNPTCQRVDDPNGVGTTLIYGVNDKGDLVGSYADSAGKVHGFLATPR